MNWHKKKIKWSIYGFHSKWLSKCTEKDLEELYQIWIKKNDIKDLIAHTTPKADFYNTSEWRRTRYKFIRSRQTKRCELCKSKDNELHVDHIKPRWIYPELAFEFSNLRLLCKDCNLGKGGDVPMSNEPRKIILRKKFQFVGS